jgi:hypothetical protein
MANGKIGYLRNSRLILGLSPLLLGPLSAGLISKEANRTIKVWVASSNLAPGMTLTDTDITSVSVLLPSSAKNYISTKAQSNGGIVVKPRNNGDLIPVSTIANSPISLNQKIVPITSEITDCPLNINRGNIVNIYVIPNQDSKFTDQPQLVAQNISVAEVFNQSNSGKISILVILEEGQVLPIIQFNSDTRVLMVRSL